MENQNSIIEIKNLTKCYGAFIALDDISVSIPAGKIVGLVGPNGSGKTTLIKIVASLLLKYQGELLIDGLRPGVDTKSIVSFLPDCDFLPGKWNFYDIINFYKDFFPDFAYQKAEYLLRQLQIDPEKKFMIHSKGNKEKIQLIVALCRKAKVYIFDEPIAGVDPAARKTIFDLILSTFDRQCSIIICTHLISEVEEILDYAVFLSNGKISLRGDVSKIKESSGKSLNDVFKEMYNYAPIT